MTRIFHRFFMWKMDPISGFDIPLVFTLPPRDSTLQYKNMCTLLKLLSLPYNFGFSNYIFHKLLYTFFIPLQIVQYTFLIPFRFFSTLFIPFMTAVHSLFLSESTFYPFKELQNTFFPFRKWQYTYSFQKVL